jgi:Homeodomain-like domain
MLSAVSGAGEFELTDQERDRLVGLSRGESARRVVRTRIVLALAEPGAVPARVAADLGVTVATVDKWRKRFEVAGVDGLIERWFGLLTDQLLRRGVHKSVAALENDVRGWITAWNDNPTPFRWTKTADEILDSLAKYMARISGAGH